MSIDPIILSNVAMGFAAIITIIVTVILYHISNKSQRELQTKVMNHETLIVSDEMIRDNPDLLMYLGITKQDFANLKKLGVSKKDVAFLYLNFKGGASFREILSKDNRESFEPENYRYIILLNSKSRATWKVIRKAFEDDIFKVKMDATVELLDSKIGTTM